MAVEITSDNFEQYFIQTQDKFTRSLEQAEGARGCTVVTDLESIRDVLSMPGVRYSLNPITEPNAIAQAYVQIPYSILADALENMEDATDEASSAAEQATEAAGNVQTAIDNANTAAGTANTAAQNADASRQQIEANESTRQSNETTRQQNETTRQSNETTRINSEQSRASSEQGRVSAEFSRVSAEQSRVSAEQSRVSQASSDHTRAENDHTRAGQDHSRAETDHSTASDDHSTAGTDHNRAEDDHTASAAATAYAKEQGDYAKDWTDHPPYIGDGTTGDLNFWYLYDIQTEQYVKGPYAKGDNMEWDDITPAEKQILINEMLQTLEDEGFDAVPTEGSSKPVRSGGIYTALQTKQDNLTFASVAICEAIVDELI